MRRTALVLTAALTLAAGLALPVSASPGIPAQLGTVGVDGDGFPALDTPASVTPDGAGGLAVATPGGLTLLATSGQVERSVAKPGTGGAVAYVQDGAVAYSAYAGDTTLHVTAADGSAVRAYDLGGTQPLALALDPLSPLYGHKVLYVLVANQVLVLDPTSTDTTFPGHATLGGIVSRNATGLAIEPDHTLLLLDSAANEVWHYSDQGIFLGGFRIPSPDGTSVGSTGLAIDSSGTVFVSDDVGERVVEMTTSGGYLGTFGDTDTQKTYGAPPLAGQFDGPSGVAVDCLGRLWVTDTDSATHKGRVVAFSGVAARTGTCAPSPATTTFADDQAYVLATDRAGNVWTSSYGIVHKTDVAGHRVLQWGSASATAGSGPTWGLPGGMAVRANGNLLIGSYRFYTTDAYGNVTTSSGTPKVLEFRSAGALVKQETDSHITAPVLIAVSPITGHVFVYNGRSAGAPGSLQEYDASWTWLRTLVVTPVNATANAPSVTALAFDAAGDVLAAVRQLASFSSVGGNMQFDAAIERFAPGTTTPGLSSVPVLRSLFDTQAPLGMAALPDGTLLLSEAELGSVLPPYTEGLFVVKTDGTVLRHVADGQLGSQSLPRLALDCAGRVLATDVTRVLRLSWVSGRVCRWLPTATTGALVSRGTTWLKVRGYSNPSSQVTRMRVLYGTTASHGKYTAWVSLPSDNTVLYRDLAFSGLLSKHTYHYAVQVANASGTVTGADRTATTS